MLEREARSDWSIYKDCHILAFELSHSAEGFHLCFDCFQLPTFIGLILHDFHLEPDIFGTITKHECDSISYGVALAFNPGSDDALTQTDVVSDKPI